MCAGTYCQTCPPIIPCGTGPCRFSCPPPPRCLGACYPRQCGCVPRPLPPHCTMPLYIAAVPDCPFDEPPNYPVFPACRPRRRMPCPVCPKRREPPACYPPLLPNGPVPDLCRPPPLKRCPDPVQCFPPVLPMGGPPCPIDYPKQRPKYCKAKQIALPCLPVGPGCCPFYSGLDPVTRRRPLIVHNSVKRVYETCQRKEGPRIGRAYSIEVPLR